MGKRFDQISIWHGCSSFRVGLVRSFAKEVLSKGARPHSIDICRVRSMIFMKAKEFGL
jgi:hypothetical protein